jgi:hypothetical protein
MPAVRENRGESRHDAVAVRRQHVFEPPQRLHNPHRRPAGPEQLAGSGVLERDCQAVDTDGPPASVRVDHDARRNGGRQAEVVRRGQSIDQHAELIAAPERLDDAAIVGDYWTLRETADLRRVVEAAIEAPEAASMHETLERFVDGVSVAEIKKVNRGPDLIGRCVVDPVRKGLLEIWHGPVFVH